MNPDNIKLLASLAAIVAGLFGVVTVPMMRLIKSEISGLRNEMKGEFGTLRAEIKAEFILVRSEIKDVRVEMKEMENRLNERINTHLIRR